MMYRYFHEMCPFFLESPENMVILELFSNLIIIFYGKKLLLKREDIKRRAQCFRYHAIFVFSCFFHRFMSNYIFFETATIFPICIADPSIELLYKFVSRKHVECIQRNQDVDNKDRTRI